MPLNLGTKSEYVWDFEKLWRKTSSAPFSYPGKFVFGDAYVTDINHVRKQDDPGKRLMVASNLKTFIERRIFQSDEVSQSLAAVSVLVISEKKASVFWCLNENPEAYLEPSRTYTI